MSAATVMKALALLAEGRVRVQTVERVGTTCHADVLVQGSQPDPYAVSLNGDRWLCSCPARDVCSHILAAALVCGPGDCAKFLPGSRWPWPEDLRATLREVTG